MNVQIDKGKEKAEHSNTANKSQKVEVQTPLETEVKTETSSPNRMDSQFHA
jgi:hypothetical protein